VSTGSGVFTARTRVSAPFAGITPQDYQSMGLFLGTGDQDNYVKLVTSSNGGGGGIEFAKEVGGQFTHYPQPTVSMPGPDWVDLYLTVDAVAKTVQPSYVVSTNGNPGPRTKLGDPVPIPDGWVDSSKAMAVGIISTSGGGAPPFTATWDFIEVVRGAPDTTDTTAPTVSSTAPADGATGVAVGANAEATFSEAMDASTIKADTFTLAKQGTTTPVAANVGYDATAKKATLNPSADLEANTTYTATVKGGTGGVKDLAGNPLANNKSWSFTTAASTVASGLKGEYYDNQDLTNLKLTRTDPKVDFSWGTGSPDPSIAPDTFSVRWSGQLKADHTETYTFYTTANDGVRLWVNGQQIINRWSGGAATNTGTVSLQAGQWYSITMEYFEGSNSASAKLEYSSASTPRQVVPTDHLRPDAASP
jgi:Bacterial Ig-like domain/PA14 domain